MKNISQIHTVGIDLAKNVIQIFAADREGQRVMNRRFSRNKAMKFFESLPPCMGAQCDRHGGLLEFPSLGAQSDSDGSTSANDAGAVCKTVCQDRRRLVSVWLRFQALA